MQEIFNFDAPVPVHIFQYILPHVRREQHWHSFYEIGYCMEGSGIFYIGDKTISFTQGDLMFFPPYEPHIAASDLDSNCKCSFVYFSDTLLPDEDRQLLWSMRDSVIRSRDISSEEENDFPDLHRFFNQLFAEYTVRRSGYETLLRSGLMDLSVRLHRLEENHYSSELLGSRLRGFRQIKPALDYLEQHFKEEIELKDIAAILSLSPSRTRHLFKQYTGKRFVEYLTFVRIQHAKRLLATSSLTVTEIYLSCGYQSSAPFYRSFQLLVGLTPSQYRERHSFGKV